MRTFVLHYNLPWPLKAHEMPQYTEKRPVRYHDDQINAILAAATPDEFELLSFFLCTGGREQDVQYARWSNINFPAKKFCIEEDIALGYIPKDKEEDAIPIPDYLIDLLRARKGRYPGTQLIFPTRSGKPNGHLLRIIKRIALRAGLNCGYCWTKPRRKKDGTLGKSVCCDKHPVCSQWVLHKWRKSFATLHHENGVPVRQIQKWLRHSDLETTLRYLASGDDESPAARLKVNSTFAGFQRTPFPISKSA